MVFHVLEGEIDLTVGEWSHELEAGHVVQFDGARSVAVDALTDARALVVLARKPEPEDGGGENLIDTEQGLH